MLELREVYHDYTRGSITEPVLRGVDLSMKTGEFVVLMGPSGCGKTTLLNVIGLMMTPTRAATVKVGDRETLGLSDGERTRLRRESIGFVFQRFNLLPTINVARNVGLPLRIRGTPVDGQVDRLIDRVGLTPFARKKPGQLSTGQQQRVAIARALVGKPAILLADEPTGNLDSANAEEVLKLLSEFHREWRQTILMITHNESLAVAADRVLRMRDGLLRDA